LATIITSVRECGARTVSGTVCPIAIAILAGRVGSGASAHRTVTDTKGGIGLTDLLTRWRALPLMWTEALRALVCLVPMMVATVLGQTTYLVTLGQGAFFFSSIFLPRRLGARFVLGSLVLGLGLGFYLIGGTVAPNAGPSSSWNARRRPTKCGNEDRSADRRQPGGPPSAPVATSTGARAFTSAATALPGPKPSPPRPAYPAPQHFRVCGYPRRRCGAVTL